MGAMSGEGMELVFGKRLERNEKLFSKMLSFL